MGLGILEDRQRPSILLLRRETRDYAETHLIYLTHLVALLNRTVSMQGRDFWVSKFCFM